MSALDGTWTYTWEHGRQLASMSNGSATWTYTYDANGMRTQRTDGTTTHNYIYAGSRLTNDMVTITQNGTTENHAMYFIYDGASSTPMAVTYDGSTYYYTLNAQGDVVAILSNKGVQVVAYTYDAWGNILSITGSMASTLGILNPLRYRGYVYDTETGLYYLQSRYYNPAMGRFINADDIDCLGSDGTLLSRNLLAY